MFLFDQRHFSVLRQSFAEFEGDRLENRGVYRDRGYEKYRITLNEETHLEDDPSFECRDYQLPGDYDQCLGTVLKKERSSRF